MMRLLLGLLALASPVLADSASDAIKKKDGAAHAAHFADAIRVNVRPEMRAELAPIVAAIRHAENGRAGREYGVLHPSSSGQVVPDAGGLVRRHRAETLRPLGQGRAQGGLPRVLGSALLPGGRRQ